MTSNIGGSSYSTPILSADVYTGSAASPFGNDDGYLIGSPNLYSKPASYSGPGFAKFFSDPSAFTGAKAANDFFMAGLTIRGPGAGTGAGGAGTGGGGSSINISGDLGSLSAPSAGSPTESTDASSETSDVDESTDTPSETADTEEAGTEDAGDETASPLIAQPEPEPELESQPQPEPPPAPTSPEPEPVPEPEPPPVPVVAVVAPPAAVETPSPTYSASYPFDIPSTSTPATPVAPAPVVHHPVTMILPTSMEVPGAYDQGFVYAIANMIQARLQTAPAPDGATIDVTCSNLETSAAAVGKLENLRTYIQDELEHRGLDIGFLHFRGSANPIQYTPPVDPVQQRVAAAQEVADKLNTEFALHVDVSEDGTRIDISNTNALLEMLGHSNNVRDINAILDDLPADTEIYMNGQLIDGDNPAAQIAGLLAAEPLVAAAAPPAAPAPAPTPTPASPPAPTTDTQTVARADTAPADAQRTGSTDSRPVIEGPGGTVIRTTRTTTTPPPADAGRTSVAATPPSTTETQRVSTAPSTPPAVTPAADYPLTPQQQHVVDLINTATAKIEAYHQAALAAQRAETALRAATDENFGALRTAAATASDAADQAKRAAIAAIQKAKDEYAELADWPRQNLADRGITPPDYSGIDDTTYVFTASSSLPRAMPSANPLQIERRVSGSTLTAKVTGGAHEQLPEFQVLDGEDYEDAMLRGLASYLGGSRALDGDVEFLAAFKFTFDEDGYITRIEIQDSQNMRRMRPLYERIASELIRNFRAPTGMGGTTFEAALRWPQQSSIA